MWTIGVSVSRSRGFFQYGFIILSRLYKLNCSERVGPPTRFHWYGQDSYATIGIVWKLCTFPFPFLSRIFREDDICNWFTTLGNCTTWFNTWRWFMIHDYLFCLPHDTLQLLQGLEPSNLGNLGSLPPPIPFSWSSRTHSRFLARWWSQLIWSNSS